MPDQSHEIKTLLLVDDDEVHHEVVRRVVKRASLGLEIKSAFDGREALTFLQENMSADAPPTLVLLDLNMPGMSGFEFLEAVRKDPALSSLLVLVLTTSDNAGDIDRAYRQHVAGYLVKDRLGDRGEGLAELIHNLKTRSWVPPLKR